MESKFYKIGKTVINMLTPQKLSDDIPFSLFECSPCAPDCMVCFNFAQLPFENPQEIVYENDFFFVTENNSEKCFYYKHKTKNGCYAMRKKVCANKFFENINSENINPNALIYNNECLYFNITLLPEYEQKLWTRVAFNICGFEDMLNTFGEVILHASFVTYKNYAVLFTAPCGTGKSTQAELWQKAFNAEIINGDKALLYFNKNTLFASGLPFSGTSGICKNEAYPVKAIVRLSQAEQNTISRLNGVSAFSAVYKGCYRPIENADNAIYTVEKAILNVPVFSLCCLPDASAALLTKNTLFGGK